MKSFNIDDVLIVDGITTSITFGKGDNASTSVSKGLDAMYKGVKIGRLEATTYTGNEYIRYPFTMHQFEHNMDRSLWIDEVKVEEEFRFKGVCTKLFKCAEEWLEKFCQHKRNNYYIFATHPSHKVFEKLGYSVIGCGSNYTEYMDGCWGIQNDLYPIDYHEMNLGYWMAKPIGDFLDREKYKF